MLYMLYVIYYYVINVIQFSYWIYVYALCLWFLKMDKRVIINILNL